MDEARVNVGMVQAGTEAVLERLPIEVFDERSIDPGEFVTAVFKAMAGREWETIENAPRNGSTVLLAVADPSDVKVGIGMWVDAGDDTGTGTWSTEGWWGKPPTHWRPIPPAPRAG